MQPSPAALFDRGDEMTNDKRALRHAIAAFENIPDLKTALGVIENAGVRPSAVSVLATSAAFNLRGIAREAAPIGVVGDAATICVTKGDLFAFLKKAGASPHRALLEVMQAVLPPRQAVLMARRLTNGVSTLWVDVPDEDSEGGICRLLMAFSHYPIEVHDLVAPRNPPPARARTRLFGEDQERT